MSIIHPNVDSTNNYHTITIINLLQTNVKYQQLAFKVDFAIAVGVKYVNNTLYKRVLM